MSMSINLIQKINTYIASKRFVSRHTNIAVKHDLHKLLHHAQKLEIGDWHQLTHQHIHYLLLNFNKSGLRTASIKRWLSNCKQFFNWLENNNATNKNPFLLVKAPKMKQVLPPTMSVDETFALLDGEHVDIKIIRDKSMFEILYSGGLRVTEMVNLNIDDIELGKDSQQRISSEIIVTGKRNKQRKTILGEKAIIALQKWLEHRIHWVNNSQEKALFLTQSGKRISVRTVQDRIAKHGIKSGLANRVHPHKLRHACATHMLESSNDLRIVQEVLGHASIKTTQIYTRLDFSHLAKVYDSFHPRAKKTT